MIRTVFLILMFSILFNNTLKAQEVVTLVQSPYIQDGLYVDPQGNVYTTCGGLVQKTTLGMYSPETREFKVLSNDMRGSIDIASNNGKELYITNYDDNTIKKFELKTGKTISLATGLDGPAGIEIDKLGNLYVTNFGAPPAYNGNSVWKISPDGKKELVIESDDLFRPQGIAWYDENILIVSNSSNGKLFLLDIQSQKLTLFVNTGRKHGNIAIGRDKIYMASNKGHCVLEYNRKGELTAIFGDKTIETKDGVIREANFARPLGLAFSPDEKQLYVAQIQNGYLRCIIFED